MDFASSASLACFALSSAGYTVYGIRYTVDVMQSLTDRRTHANALMNTHVDRHTRTDEEAQ